MTSVKSILTVLSVLCAMGLKDTNKEDDHTFRAHLVRNGLPFVINNDGVDGSHRYGTDTGNPSQSYAHESSP